MTEGSNAQDKRQLILSAAVRVFARKGYHTCRVGDIAEEAGVAHGLLYHYFPSKEAVLETVFRESWTQLVDAVKVVEESDEPAPERLGRVAALILRSWQQDADLVRVLVREVARSPQLERRLDAIGEVFNAIYRIVKAGQADGSFRADLDARLVTWIFYGGIEEVLTGWVLGQLPDGDEEVERAQRTLVDLVCGGLATARAPEPV